MSDTSSYAKEKALWGFDVLVKVSVPLLLGVAGWTFTSLQDHEKRLNVIEATRYTRKDAETETRLTREMLSTIRQTQAVVLEKLSSQEKQIDKIVKALDSH